MSEPKKKLGLDNEERVRRVYDRGEGDLHYPSSHASQGHTQSNTDGSDPIKPKHVCKEIGKELDASQVMSALDPNKEFIPRKKLTETITLERVRIILDQNCFKGVADKDKLAVDICFGSNRRVKLVAVLIGMKQLNDLPRHIKDGVHDKCLPMRMKSVSGQGNNKKKTKKLYCLHHKKYHDFINRDERSEDRDRFSVWSYRLSAPYIKYNEKKHSHYILHYGDIFPMDSEFGGKLQREDVPGTEHGGPMNAMPQYGGYSEVYKVKIDRSHYDFGDSRMRHPNEFFALKKLTSHNREQFNLELSSLLFSMDNASGKSANSHLIQLLATFEVPLDPAGQVSTFYLLFDWAEGNLKDFWRDNQHLVGDRSHSVWMAQQFHEICSAVRCIHNEREETLKFTDTSRLAKGPPGRTFSISELYGRHGDIKPDNFLWFHPARSPSDLIALSDFGLGRLHTQVSRSNQDPRKLAYTATYIAPEFDLPDGMISRASDIFSLGCVFLEHATWYLKGFDSVMNDFPGRRSDKDIYGFEADKFFIIHPDASGKQRPFLKPKVKDWISELQQHENCTWYIFQLLEVIRDDMLEPDRNKRIHITSLIKKMDTLRQACERNDSFYLKTIREA